MPTSNCLLKRCDIRRAAAILEPFRDSTDEDIQKRLELLRRLEEIKKPKSLTLKGET